MKNVRKLCNTWTNNFKYFKQKRWYEPQALLLSLQFWIIFINFLDFKSAINITWFLSKINWLEKSALFFNLEHAKI